MSFFPVDFSLIRFNLLDVRPCNVTLRTLARQRQCRKLIFRCRIHELLPCRSTLYDLNHRFAYQDASASSSAPPRFKLAKHYSGGQTFLHAKTRRRTERRRQSERESRFPNVSLFPTHFSRREGEKFVTCSKISQSHVYGSVRQRMLTVLSDMTAMWRALPPLEVHPLTTNTLASEAPHSQAQCLHPMPFIPHPTPSSDSPRLKLPIRASPPPITLRYRLPKQPMFDHQMFLLHPL